MEKPHWKDIDKGKTYVIGGKRLSDLMRRSTDVHGMLGQIDVYEEPDGSVTIGLSSTRVCYIVANGLAVKCIMPVVIVVE